MLPDLFYNHGHICASHPWEVIVAFTTFTICMLSVGPKIEDSKIYGWNYQCSVTEALNKDIDIVIMTITRCMAVLFIYHQFRKLHKWGSKYLIGITGLFTVFSCFIFSTSVWKYFEGNFSKLNEAIPFFLLLIDLPKAGLLTQFTLSSSSKEEVSENIAKGMAVLGPAITLDTLVETLLIRFGTLSGVRKLEEISCFAVLSVLVNYIVFMTFFPACLSLVLELNRSSNENRPGWQVNHFRKILRKEKQKSNPVLQRVKLIMSAGLLLVHSGSYWLEMVAEDPGIEHRDRKNDHWLSDRSFLDNNSILEKLFYSWSPVNSEQLFTLVLASALAVKYIFFENKEELEKFFSATDVMSQSQSNCLEMTNTNNMNDVLPRTAGLSHYRQASLHFQNCMSTSHGVPSIVSVPASPFSVTSVSFTVGDDDEEKHFLDKEVQTIINENIPAEDDIMISLSRKPRPVKKCFELLNSMEGSEKLSDEEILLLLENEYIAAYKLESLLDNPERGVAIRRRFVTKVSNCYDQLRSLPYKNYDYSLVMGACCENVVGYMPIPVGVAGPLVLDGKHYQVPMATTEGCLVASANRGCRAILLSGGVSSSVVSNGMTRAPVVRLRTACQAAAVMKWLQKKENFENLKTAFDSTSRFARLKKLQVKIAGRYLFIRFIAVTGDAMGMNMLSKGTERALKTLQETFSDLEILSLSGNFCSDKKSSAVNWILSRGKSVVCEAEVSKQVVEEVLKTTVQALIDVNISKNLVGSALAGSIGGFNAQAANIVTAIFIATGQLLGLRGSSSLESGENANTLARIVCGTVLAGELSLLSALAAGHLVRAHLKHNRSNLNMSSSENEQISLSHGEIKTQLRVPDCLDTL
ncbi:3-hydroxy-3-methylglutaryl-coenzyme A reductase-like isoform X3 [Tachypleus tridentatus]|uniref:3-hydroxy-3-methylglutaryl-coenzyme A reductase-like isoform X3 n=1 Tax=Tachypleus tridentatus TaxID=6853 RepID=UPI003FD172EE